MYYYGLPSHSVIVVIHNRWIERENILLMALTLATQPLQRTLCLGVIHKLFIYWEERDTVWYKQFVGMLVEVKSNVTFIRVLGNTLGAAGAWTCRSLGHNLLHPQVFRSRDLFCRTDCTCKSKLLMSDALSLLGFDLSCQPQVDQW